MAFTKKKKSFLENIKYEYMVAGLSGGVVSTAILHPFDLIKIRFQGKDYPPILWSTQALQSDNLLPFIQFNDTR